MRARRALSLIATSLLLVCGCAATNPPAAATLTAAEPRYEAEQKRLRKAIEQGGDLGPRGVEDRSPAQLAGTVEALSQLALAKRHNHMVDDELVDTLVLGVTAFAKAYDR